MNVIMSRAIFVFLNIPVISISLLVTLFFLSCLLITKSGQEEGVKQPLLVLLWSTVIWNGCVQVTIILFAGLEFSEVYDTWEYWVARSFVLHSTILSALSTSTWQSVFYYVCIVPDRRPFLVWMKKNIKEIVYWALITDRILVLLDVVLKLILQTSAMQKGQLNDIEFGTFTLASLNDTGDMGDQSNAQVLLYASFFLFHCQVFIMLVHTLGVIFSSGATVLYLWRHMKRMQATSSISFSSPQLQSQWRVTVASLVQGGLFIFCTVWIIVTDLLRWLSVDFDKNYHILTTVISLFSSGTTLILGWGQSLFRQQASSLWESAVKMYGFNRA
ncbi:uncharacterized protein LOC133116885 [Conger conger]|uniref:uncharacterized protein LOC133116885 n=1 Tax=Conger conger TaxID=82655 RepID=UPI002A59E63C|nr:uncharacterized protein LOC133116885 [Conger conger]